MYAYVCIYIYIYLYLYLYMYTYVYIYIWWFPKIGVPLVILPAVDGISVKKTKHSYGVPP